MPQVPTLKVRWTKKQHTRDTRMPTEGAVKEFAALLSFDVPVKSQ